MRPKVAEQPSQEWEAAVALSGRSGWICPERELSKDGQSDYKSSLMISVVSSTFCSAVLQFYRAHYSSRPCSDFTHLCSDLSLLTPEINLFWISRENIADEQLISSRHARSCACLIYMLWGFTGWNWRRMEGKIRFCYLPRVLSQKSTPFPSQGLNSCL